MLLLLSPQLVWACFPASPDCRVAGGGEALGLPGHPTVIPTVRSARAPAGSDASDLSLRSDIGEGAQWAPRSGDGAPACSVLGWSCPADPGGRVGKAPSRTISVARRACKAPQALQKGDRPQTDLRGSPERGGTWRALAPCAQLPSDRGPQLMQQGAWRPPLAPGGCLGPGVGLLAWLRAEGVGGLSRSQEHLPGIHCLHWTGVAQMALRCSLSQALGPFLSLGVCPSLALLAGAGTRGHRPDKELRGCPFPICSGIPGHGSKPQHSQSTHP